jgi:hypothetical protein
MTALIELISRNATTGAVTKTEHKPGTSAPALGQSVYDIRVQLIFV